MRAISVSISPSIRSSCADLPADPVARQPLRRAPARWRKICARKRAWVSLITLRKSGIWQTSQSRRTAPGLVASAAMSGIARQRLQRAVVVGLARRHRAPACGGRSSRLLQQARRPSGSRAGVAPVRAASAARSGASRPPRRCSGRAALVGGGAEGAVAHVAAGAAGDLRDLGRRSGGAGRGRRTCASRAKATWSRSMLSPMPIASVATR